MRCICRVALAATSVAVVLSGCQHAPPAPLDLKAALRDAGARDVNVEPVRAYAAALAAAHGEAGAPFDTSDGLSLREGQAVALWYNAELRIARLEAAGAGAAAGAAGILPDLALGLESGEKKVDGEGAGFLRRAGESTRSWINLASLTITVPLSGRLGAERQYALAEQAVARERVLEAEWQALADVRAAWAAWSAAEERVALLDSHLAVLGEFAPAARALADAGELAPSGARLFEIERLRHDAARERARGDALELRGALLHLLGLLPDAPVALVPGLAAALPAGEAVPAEEHPTVARLRAEHEAAERRLRLELRKQYPDLAISPTYADEQDETALTLGLGLPVPVWNANRQGIAEAKAARDTARARAEAGLERLLSERARAQAALDAGRAQRARLAEGAVPAVDRQLEETLALLRVGEADLVLIHEALQQALETKLDVLEAAQAEAQAAARLAAFTGADARALGAKMETNP